jgi:hypothetical protein
MFFRFVQEVKKEKFVERHRINNRPKMTCHEGSVGGGGRGGGGGERGGGGIKESLE